MFLLEINYSFLSIRIKTRIDTYYNTCYNEYIGRGDAMKSYSSKELIKLIEKNGWYLVHTRGSHHQFKHPTKPNRVTIPHPKKDVPIKTVKSILKQAGLE